MSPLFGYRSATQAGRYQVCQEVGGGAIGAVADVTLSGEMSNVSNVFAIKMLIPQDLNPDSGQIRRRIVIGNGKRRGKSAEHLNGCGLLRFRLNSC